MVDNREKIDEEELKKEELAFILLYITAQKKLIEIVSTKRLRSNNIEYGKRITSQAADIFKDLMESTKDWVNNNIPKTYKKAVYKSIDNYKDKGIEAQPYEKFSNLHEQQIKILQQQAIDNLADTTNYLNNNVKRTIKQIVNESVIEAKRTGKSIAATRDIIMQKFVDNDITIIMTKNNRKISLDNYAKMVARTTTAEANNLGMINHVKANGEDLVIMSSHGSTCGICAPLEGRVYSISGNSTKYPPLSMAHTGAYGVIHPNCRHYLRPYVPEIDENVEQTEKFSNRPFDIDPRTQEQINRYNQTQSDNVKRNNEKRQWERYKIILPDATPKTLAGFRRMKRSGSKNWLKLQSTYRKERLKKIN